MARMKQTVYIKSERAAKCVLTSTQQFIEDWVSRKSGPSEPVERAMAAGDYLLHRRFTKR